jgi:hypothetical protein
MIPYLRAFVGTFNRASGSAPEGDTGMAMSPKKRAALETKIIDHLNRVRISPTGIRNAGAIERVAVKVMRDGDDIYLAAIEEAPRVLRACGSTQSPH